MYSYFFFVQCYAEPSIVGNPVLHSPDISGVKGQLSPRTVSGPSDAFVLYLDRSSRGKGVKTSWHS